MRVYDDNWEDWKVGDTIVWCDDKNKEDWIITKIDRGYVYWIDNKYEFGKENMTRVTSMLRVTTRED